MANNEKGYAGEWLAKEYIHSLNMTCLQPDWIMRDPNTEKYFVCEMKNKNVYTKTLRNGSKWYGMGLPIYQVEARLQLQKDKDMRVLLLWTDVELCDTIGKKWLDVVFHRAWLDELEQSMDYYEIPHPKNGGAPIRIYNVQLFTQSTVRVDARKLREKLIECSK